MNSSNSEHTHICVKKHGHWVRSTICSSWLLRPLLARLRPLLYLSIAVSCCTIIFGVFLAMNLMGKIVSSSSVPHTAAVSFLEASSTEKNCMQRDMSDAERQVLCCTPTPYGPLLQQLTAWKTNGQSFTVSYVKPAALLWMAVSNHRHLATSCTCLAIPRRSVFTWTTSGARSGRTMAEPTSRGTIPCSTSRSGGAHVILAGSTSPS